MGPKSSVCRTVWNGLHILPDGYIRLCSLGTNTNPDLDMQRARDRNGNLMHILTHDLHDIMNSDKHREVRCLNVNNSAQWSPHCECCENRESLVTENHRNASRRIYLNKIMYTPALRNLDKLVTEDGTIDWLPSSLDIRFGNLCNQKCIMCGPHFSNMWYDEYVDYYKTTSFGLVGNVKIVRDIKTNKWIDPPELAWFENPIWWAKFDQMMPTLQHIYITGGEPMVAPAHDEMLDKLIASGYAKNIALEYDTNLSALNTKIIDRWYHFKSVLIRASMDATEEQYELIRFGGKWDKFVENIKRIKQISVNHPNIRIEAITSCVQIPTLYSIITSEKFCRDMGVHFHIRFLEGPAIFSVNHLPRDLKVKMIEYFDQFKLSEKAPLIVAHLKNYLDKEVQADAIQKFKEFMDYLDQSRNTDWRKILPEVDNLLK